MEHLTQDNTQNQSQELQQNKIDPDIENQKNGKNIDKQNHSSTDQKQQEQNKEKNVIEKQTNKYNQSIENKQEIKQQQIQTQRYYRFKSGLLIVFVGLCHGLLAFIFLPSFIYQKEKLELQPSIIQAISALIITPWCFKMLFGYLIDKLIQKFQRRKILLLISYTIRFLVMILFSFLSPDVFFFCAIVIIINLTVLFENIISEYTAVLETKKLSAIKESKNENQMPLFYGARAIGALFGTYFGGRALRYFTVQQCYLIYAVFPLILFSLTLLYKEDEVQSKKSTFIQDLRKMKIFLFKKNILLFMMFVFIVNLTPNFDSLITFYLQDYLHFNTKDLADLSAFATLCYIIGLLLYYYVYRKHEPIKFFKRTLLFQLIANLLFLLVVFNIVRKLRLNSKFFCMFTQGAQALVSELNFMPVLAIWTYSCPKDLEATSITVFTGFFHICQVFSGLFGAMLIWILHTNKNDYSKLWILIVIQNSYLLIVMISLLFFQLPKMEDQEELNKKNEQEEEQNQNLSEIRMLKVNENLTINTIEAVQLIYKLILKIMVKFSLNKIKKYSFDFKYYFVIQIAQIFILYLLPICLIFSSRQSFIKRHLVFRL